MRIKNSFPAAAAFVLAVVFFVIVSAGLTYAQKSDNNIRSLLSSQGKVLFGDEPNSIIVIDYPDNIRQVAEYLEQLDVPSPQVLIEARVVEVKLQKEHSLGVNWNAFTDKGYMPLGRFKAGSSALGAAPGQLEQAISYKPTYYPPLQSATGQESPFTIGIFDDNINVVVKALANSLETDILSAPRITTVNNREAEIKIIQSLPWAEPEVQVSGTSGTITITWKINFEEVGIILKATPTINEDGRITMILDPEISEKTSDYNLTVTQGSTSVPYTVPIIDKRSASTKVIVGNGQTLIIGGLIKDKKVNGATKVPLLGDLPFLGYLFKSKKETTDKTELMIFVSPTIIVPEEFDRMARQERYGIGRNYTRERDSLSRLTRELEKEEISALEEKVNKDAARLRKKAIEQCLPSRGKGSN